MAYIINNSSRGTIVVDACSLKHLCPQLNPAHVIEKGRGIRRFTDLLRFLAGHGFHIIIPEMVAYECGDIGTKGKSLDNFFPKSAARKEEGGAKQYRYGHPEEVRQLQTFLELVRSNRIPNIEMRPTDGPEKVAELVEQLRTIAQGPITEANRWKLIDLFHSSSKDQFGDLEVVHVVKDLKNRGVSTPIYVLTEDMRTLAQAIQKECPYAHLINANGLVEAMTGNGLNRTLGLIKKADAQILNADRYMKVVEYNRGQKGPDELFVIDHTSTCKIGYLPVKRPFHTSMMALSQANDLSSYDNVAVRQVHANPVMGRSAQDYQPGRKGGENLGR